MNNESRETFSSYVYLARVDQPEQNPLKRAANDAASLVYRLIERSGNNLHYESAGCQSSDNDRYQLGNLDADVAAYYFIDADLDYDVKIPHVLTYSVDISWFDKPDLENSLHKIQYRVTYDHFEPYGVVIEPDYKTELLKTGEAPQLVQRAMELQDYEDLRQFADYILTMNQPDQTAKNSW